MEGQDVLGGFEELDEAIRGSRWVAARRRCPFTMSTREMAKNHLSRATLDDAETVGSVGVDGQGRGRSGKRASVL